MYKFDREAYDRRMEWYRDARFGMFIHWGLYAIPARGEWVRSTEQIPKEDYMKYFEEFNPVDFEPRKWAKAAKEAGMKYMVLTAKHHDGFCLFDSQYTDFKSTNTKCGRDTVQTAYILRRSGYRFSESRVVRCWVQGMIIKILKFLCPCNREIRTSYQRPVTSSSGRAALAAKL